MKHLIKAPTIAVDITGFRPIASDIDPKRSVVKIDGKDAEKKLGIDKDLTV